MALVVGIALAAAKPTSNKKKRKAVSQAVKDLKALNKELAAYIKANTPELALKPKANLKSLARAISKTLSAVARARGGAYSSKAKLATAAIRKLEKALL